MGLPIRENCARLERHSGYWNEETLYRRLHHLENHSGKITLPGASVVSRGA